MLNPSCRLCGSLKCTGLLHNAWRKALAAAGLSEFSHLHCHHCDLIFLRGELLPNPILEKERYENHQNQVGDANYLQVFTSLVEYLLASVPENQRTNCKILDYGSGPSPVLASHLLEIGFQVEIYDPFFAPKDLSKLSEQNYLLVTEVVEHFHAPKAEFTNIAEIANKKAAAPAEILIMTQLHRGESAFIDWWYPRDTTHVAFYSEKTLDWIRQEFGIDIQLIDPSNLLSSKLD